MVSGLLGGIAGGATVAITIKAVDEFSGTFRKAETGIGALSGLATAGATALLALGAGLTAVGVSSGKVAADFEQTQVAFTTMLGSAEEADRVLKELADFARKTPFTLTGVERAAIQLKAVGFETEELIPTLKAVGDVASGLGLGQEGLQRLILNLGQVRAQGKLTGRELRDFAVAGVPIREVLAKDLGVTTEAIAEMVSAGEIGFEQVAKAFESMSGEGGRFFNLMEKQAKTTAGRFSNLQDAIELLQRRLGQAFLPVVGQLIDVLIEDLLPAIEPLIPILGEFFANAIKIVIPFVERLSEKIEEAAQFFRTDIQPAIEQVTPIIMELGQEIFVVFQKLQAELLPTIRQWIPMMIELFKVIAPLIPPLLQLVTNIILIAMKLQQLLLPAITQVAKAWGSTFGQALQFVIKWLEGTVKWVLMLVEAIQDLLGLGGSRKGESLKVSMPGGDSDVIHLNDFIITKGGKIIQPNPDDTIMGFKGGMPGNTFIFNIERISGTDPEEMMEAFQRELNKKIRI